jgi:exosome complex RNA-binding protein Rrp42 (RNase PH superfamily)
LILFAEILPKPSVRPDGRSFPDDLRRIADTFDAATKSTADALRTASRLKAVSSEPDTL